MDRVRKLEKKLGDAELAQALVEAGFDNPAKIRAAKDKDLETVKGVGKGKLAQVRARFTGK